VEDARADYVKAQAKIAVESSSEPAPAAAASSFESSEYGYAEEHGFLYWLKSGFAFTLPLQILGIIGLVIWILSATPK